MTDGGASALESLQTYVAAHGLATAHVAPEPEWSDQDFTAAIDACGQERTLGLLGEAVRSGAVVVTEEQRRSLDDGLAGQHAHGLRVERLLVDAIEGLDAAGIESRVLKGIALAHTVYPAPEWRVFADADLLLPSDAFDEGLQVLEAVVEARRDVPELRRGFDARFGKEVLLRARGSLELDVHRMFVEGALGLTIDLTDLFVEGVGFTLAGRTLQMLPPPQQLLHAAYAAVLGEQPPRLMSLRDVAQIVTNLRPDPETVTAMARRWRAEGVLARALNSAWDALALVEGSPLIEWAKAYSPDRVERMLLSSHVASNRAHTRHLAALVVLPGVRARASYVRALAFPSADYLEGRGFTRTGFVRRAWRSLH